MQRNRLIHSNKMVAQLEQKMVAQLEQNLKLCEEISSDHFVVHLGMEFIIVWTILVVITGSLLVGYICDII